MNDIRLIAVSLAFVCAGLASQPLLAQETLFSGDADMDGDFDQCDLVQVQVAAKYLTGQLATWGEGDWDGAPGGEPGNAPAGNGLFDQLDVISVGWGFFQGDGQPCVGLAIEPNGVRGDEQTSLIYDSFTGEVAVDAPAGMKLTSINIDSAAAIFTGDRAQNLGHSFDNDRDNNIFKATIGFDFGSVSFGDVAKTGLAEDFLLNDLTVIGSLAGGGNLGNVDMIYVPLPQLLAGDADQDLDFDQLDLVQVQVAAKYLTGQPATWGEGDWDGAPGGSQGNPPVGDGVFDQKDIIAALQSGTYLTGAYAAIARGGVIGDDQTSIGYNASTGEVWVDAPAGIELTSINIDSAAGIFTGWDSTCFSLFCNDADNNIYRATFGGSFGSFSFGEVAQASLSEAFVLNDLTVVGSLAGGGDLGVVDLIYVPEPPTVVLLAIVVGTLAICRACRAVFTGDKWCALPLFHVTVRSWILGILNRQNLAALDRRTRTSDGQQRGRTSESISH